MDEDYCQRIFDKLRHGRTFEDLLEDDAFVSDLQAGFNDLSPDARYKLQSLIVPKPSASSSTRLASAKLKSLLNVKHEDVRLCPIAREHMAREWVHDWTSFFNPSSTSLTQTSATAQAADLKQLLSNYYCEVLHLQNRRTVDRLRWRFYTMFFYDLNLLINRQVNLTTRASNNILSAIAQTSSVSNLGEIERNLKSWVTRGHRYRNLSSALGGSGILFFLPENISDYLWEEALPLNGPAFEEACELLRSFSILEKAESSNASRIASTIESGLLTPFQWSVLTVDTEQLTWNQ